jgi:hypothetical protein
MSIRTYRIPSREAKRAKFAGLNARVPGIPAEPVPCLKAWVEGLGGFPFRY